MSMTIQTLEWKDLGRERFQAEFTNNKTPVILRGAFDQWTSRQQWTPDYFRRKHGHVDVKVDGKIWKLGDLVDAIERSKPDQPAPYLRNENLTAWAPETGIMDEISPLPECLQDNWFLKPSMKYLRHWLAPQLYIGGAGAKFPVLHYDFFHVQVLLFQFYGEKEYLVYPPDQSAFLYPDKGFNTNKSLVRDPDEVDLAKFPEFPKAQGIRFRLKAGEVLFVPAGWWHTVKIVSTSITLSFDNLTSDNWPQFKVDLVAEAAMKNKLRAAAIQARLGLCDLRRMVAA